MKNNAFLRIAPRCIPALILVAIANASGAATGARDVEELVNSYPAASHTPDSQRGWEKFQTQADPDAPKDEPMGGLTAAGSPVNKRNAQCFPAETRNLFWQVDMIFDEAKGGLMPFDYRNNLHVDSSGRNAIRGQNTWMLWAEGNEAFWNWLQQHGYGLADFMILLDSRQRDSRFRLAGMINQPGMKASLTPNELGLYLDVADGDRAVMTQPEYDVDENGLLAKRPDPPPTHDQVNRQDPFEPYDRSKFQRALSSLADDGVDTSIYGYPSGVVGLRLFPNPDFFGKTKAAELARTKWDKTVTSNPDSYYKNVAVAADPGLVRPFRIGMSCAFCHVGPHPLNPPTNVESPEWANLSSIIGNQYWAVEKIFANLLQDGMNLEHPSFLRQFLASQQPGTIDTSLVSTDHINNANTIISIFDFPARLARALQNHPESQSHANLLLDSVEEVNDAVNPRHTPRILVDGADSIGTLGALARVYLNIGTHPDQWAGCHNPIIGFRPQRPFSVATLTEKSVYWNSAATYRVPALASFFTHVDKSKNKNIASPMKLEHAPGGAAIIAAESEAASAGRAVFVDNCAICHSSKQPQGFELKFDREWRAATAPGIDDAMSLTLPYDFSDWQDFKKSKSYGAYVGGVRRLEAQRPDGKDFLEDNFLASEVRIPVTLVGTNSGRAVATNAMRGQVWDNFSSEEYKHLPAVGPVRFFNPYSTAKLDEWGNNDYYFPPEGGPGYYRPASLIGLWATAPYLHNNALGIYTHDPSVESRIAAFDDGISRLFSRNLRLKKPSTVAGDLRFALPQLADRDVGMIYRTTESTTIAFSPKFVKPLLVGILGDRGVSIATFWAWIVLAVVFAILAIFARARHVGFLLTLVAVLTATLIVIGRFDRITWMVWIVPAAAVGLALLFFLRTLGRWLPRSIFIALTLASLAVAVFARGFVAGEHGGISLGPIPRGTPVNLIMNMNPEAPPGKLLRGATALLRAIHLSDQESGEEAKLKMFEAEAGQALLEASKCPDFVLDRGHWFAEDLTYEQKDQLKAFLRTL